MPFPNQRAHRIRDHLMRRFRKSLGNSNSGSSHRRTPDSVKGQGGLGVALCNGARWYCQAVSACPAWAKAAIPVACSSFGIFDSDFIAF